MASGRNMIFSFDGVPETRQGVNTPQLRISSALRVETPRQRSSGNGPSSSGGHGGNINGSVSRLVYCKFLYLF